MICLCVCTFCIGMLYMYNLTRENWFKLIWLINAF